eukprot:CAMPEP_0194399012 /NCGR_PEP_ID=MMETSP0174-20130528/126423_1 /TAXON_ID=216777 /ORGANISM="Proboscia alata, Strain PI-D3" /LENGTH=219 /DNA_ID=CAMNT_0039195371 /DNA_START=168 /DNA_END=828 /DNA_ORIENTATION=-
MKDGLLFEMNDSAEYFFYNKSKLFKDLVANDMSDHESETDSVETQPVISLASDQHLPQLEEVQSSKELLFDIEDPAECFFYKKSSIFKYLVAKEDASDTESETDSTETQSETSSASYNSLPKLEKVKPERVRHLLQLKLRICSDPSDFEVKEETLIEIINFFGSDMGSAVLLDQHTQRGLMEMIKSNIIAACPPKNRTMKGTNTVLDTISRLLQENGPI